ncbi:hypothetical protein EDB19DRAFT_12728 [Suillus lakei]|nr:hypothetical protein EDB19DRAFT_12728 [Suillus lakei]
MAISRCAAIISRFTANLAPFIWGCYLGLRMVSTGNISHRCYRVDGIRHDFLLVHHRRLLEISAVSFPNPYFSRLSACFGGAYTRTVKDHGNDEMVSSHDPRELEETLSEVPSMKWIFETSTDPEVISSVAWLLPSIKWTAELHPELHMPTICSRLLSTFKACFHAGIQTFSARRRALACGRALHHVVCDETTQNNISSKVMRFDGQPLELWSQLARPQSSLGT